MQQTQTKMKFNYEKKKSSFQVCWEEISKINTTKKELTVRKENENVRKSFFDAGNRKEKSIEILSSRSFVQFQSD